MAVQPDAPIQAGPTTGPGAPSPNPTGDQLVTAVDAPGAERLRMQAQVYAHRNDISLSAALSALPLEARLEVMKGQWEAAQAFFSSWAQSIQENAIADRAASKKAQETNQRVAAEERRGTDTKRVLGAISPSVDRHHDGLTRPQAFGFRLG